MRRQDRTRVKLARVRCQGCRRRRFVFSYGNALGLCRDCYLRTTATMARLAHTGEPPASADTPLAF